MYSCELNVSWPSPIASGQSSPGGRKAKPHVQGETDKTTARGVLHIRTGLGRVRVRVRKGPLVPIANSPRTAPYDAPF